MFSCSIQFTYIMFCFNETDFNLVKIPPLNADVFCYLCAAVNSNAYTV